MDILFNHDDKGQEEVKTLLGYLDADIKFSNLVTDIELQTPYLVGYIGQPLYEALVAYYQTEAPSEAEKTKFATVLKNAQLYVLIMAYVDFASNHDLVHGNAGRKVHNGKDEKIPWDWQIEADNAANKKRAYRALDMLFLELDKNTITEWTSSEQYKTAKSLFVFNTTVLDRVFPSINNSGQLYYKLVAHLEEVQTEKIRPLLGVDKMTELIGKLKGSPSAEEKELIRLSQLTTAYFAMERAYELFPVEMLPMDVNYRENTTMKSKARAEVAQNIATRAKEHLTNLEIEWSKQSGVSAARVLHTDYNSPDKKHFTV